MENSSLNMPLSSAFRGGPKQGTVARSMMMAMVAAKIVQLLLTGSGWMNLSMAWT